MRRIFFLAPILIAMVVGVLISVLPAQAALFDDVQVNHILPNATVDNSSGDGTIQADISEACPTYNTDGCASGGRAIEARKSYIKLYYNDPNQLYVRIQQGSGSSPGLDPSQVQFDFTPARADDTLNINGNCIVT